LTQEMSASGRAVMEEVLPLLLAELGPDEGLRWHESRRLSHRGKPRLLVR